VGGFCRDWEVRKAKATAKAKCGGLSATQQTMILSVAPVEMTLLLKGDVELTLLLWGDVELTLLL
jgi:hypothetical protein